MKILSKLAAGAGLAAVLATGSLRATSFDFSYVFGTNPTVVTGTFDGDLNGNFVDNVSNLALWFDGVAATGTVLAFQSDLASAPIISFDAALNDFYFLHFTSFDPANVDLFTYDSLFAMTSDGSATVVYAQGVFQDNPVSASWTLTATSVPEGGEMLGLLGLGLGVLVWLHGRSRARTA